MAKLSYIDKYNNKAQRELEAELSALYTTAYNEAMESVEKYWSDFEGRYVQQYAAYKEGKYTDQQWDAWVRAQQGRGSNLEKIADQMADRLAKTDQIAADYINGRTPHIYAENANFEAYMIEKDYIRTSFSLVNEEALANLAADQNNVEFKARWKEINPDMERDYEWNFKRINTSLQQGILRGENGGKIADRFMQTMKSNRYAAVRNARTALTSAQNAGRMDTWEKAREQGIEIIKEWKATFDERTRESHADLHGVRVPFDEAFPNGLMYPGDPNGAPAEVYNCRCAMGRVRSGTAAGAGKESAYTRWKENKA